MSSVRPYCPAGVSVDSLRTALNGYRRLCEKQAVAVAVPPAMHTKKPPVKPPPRAWFQRPPNAGYGKNQWPLWSKFLMSRWPFTGIFGDLAGLQPGGIMGGGMKMEGATRDQ